MLEAILERCAGLDVHKRLWRPVFSLVLSTVHQNAKSEHLEP
ncbi:hypothetical protein PACILC2_55550 [Paenibacillus cisolokensis]|uniref:Uncharacterized protein n=1 Tax=Paenibacillus cisolokensis TaxID=1658519 RepID=A0ABQ4NFG2_9BACL|nr:hypothetical protein PACILC2_55550 [Paenibacillus cisolokensis]